VSSETCQQFVQDAVKSNIFDFQFSQGSVATYCRCGGNLCDVHTENFHKNHIVKESENRSTLAKVIIKHQRVYSFLRHSV